MNRSVGKSPMKRK
jgi:hypothetical protein